MPEASTERLKANNKVPIEGTMLWDIRDVWFFNVMITEAVSKAGKTYKKRKYCGDPQDDQNCIIKLSPEGRPDIVCSHEFMVYPGEKSQWAKFAYGMLGIKPGHPMREYLKPEGGELDAKEVSRKLRDSLNGKKVLATSVVNTEGYIKFVEIRAPIKTSNDVLASIPLQSNPQLQKTPLTKEQQASEEFDDSIFKSLPTLQRAKEIERTLEAKGDKRFKFKKMEGEKISGALFEGDELPPPPADPEPAWAQGLEEDLPF